MLNFSTSLRDVVRDAQQKEEQRLANGQAAIGFESVPAPGRGLRANALDVWVEGRFMRLEDGRNGADISGHSGLVGSGVDYVSILVFSRGVSLSYDTSRQKSGAVGTEASGDECSWTLRDRARCTRSLLAGPRRGGTCEQ